MCILIPSFHADTWNKGKKSKEAVACFFYAVTAFMALIPELSGNTLQ